MEIRINDDELSSLRGRSWIAQLLYLRALRPYMDYATGVVGGPKRRISRRSLAEELHRDQRQGRHEEDSGYPSIKQIRSALLELARDLSEPNHPRPPLIRPIAADRQLIFECLLATRDSSVSNMRGRRGADVGPTLRGLEESSSDADSCDMRGRRGADPESHMRGPHPESGYPEKPEDTSEGDSPVGGTTQPLVGSPYVVGASSSSPKPAPKKKTVRGTRLSDDWVLPDAWRAWAERERPELDVEREAAIFRDYWISKSGQGATKSDWEATWRNWVRRADGGRAPRYNAAAATYAEAFGRARRR